jgi:hypothetical protein
MTMKLKAWIALQGAKTLMWLIRQGIGYVKSVTPDYALQARKASKQRILAQKAKALLTPGVTDDIAPLGAYVYMGFATMQDAQKKLMECYDILMPGAANEPANGPANQVLNVVRETIRILDE